MHPELLSNFIFLRYYAQWQEDPTSVVFAPIAEYFISVGQYDEAIAICRQGLEHNPEMVMGQVALAKAHFRKKDFPHAREILVRVLRAHPQQPKAAELMELMDQAEAPAMVEAPPPKKSSWETVTMAKIFADQGHVDQAKQVYQTILERDPSNEEALNGLKQLQSTG